MLIAFAKRSYRKERRFWRSIILFMLHIMTLFFVTSPIREDVFLEGQAVGKFYYIPETKRKQRISIKSIKITIYIYIQATEQTKWGNMRGHLQSNHVCSQWSDSYLPLKSDLKKISSKRTNFFLFFNVVKLHAYIIECKYFYELLTHITIVNLVK